MPSPQFCHIAFGPTGGIVLNLILKICFKFENIFLLSRELCRGSKNDVEFLLVKFVLNSPETKKRGGGERKGKNELVMMSVCGFFSQV